MAEETEARLSLMERHTIPNLIGDVHHPGPPEPTIIPLMSSQWLRHTNICPGRKIFLKNDRQDKRCNLEWSILNRDRSTTINDDNTILKEHRQLAKSCTVIPRSPHKSHLSTKIQSHPTPPYPTDYRQYHIGSHSRID